MMKIAGPNVSMDKLSSLISCSYALVSEEAHSLGLPDFPLDNLTFAAEILVSSGEEE